MTVVPGPFRGNKPSLHSARDRRRRGASDIEGSPWISGQFAFGT